MSGKILILLLGIAILFVFLLLWFKTPAVHRFWSDDATIVADVMIEGDKLTIKNLRDWEYSNGEVTSRTFITEEYHFNELVNTYYALQYLDRYKLTAHTFLVFEFSDGRELSLSIEARKEYGEEYSSIRGVLNTFELIYVWGTGNDIKTRRTDLYQEPIEEYQLNLSILEQQTILRSLLLETQQLSETPQFYNTLFKNCTNLLAKQANTLKPGSIPYHYSFIFTGHSVKYLNKLGYIKENEQ